MPQSESGRRLERCLRRVPCCPTCENCAFVRTRRETFPFLMFTLKWILFRPIPQACLACTEPNCDEHATVAHERFLFMGVQQKYSERDTKGWKDELITCGGRSVSCSLEKVRRLLQPLPARRALQRGLLALDGVRKLVQDTSRKSNLISIIVLYSEISNIVDDAIRLRFKHR